MFSKQHRFMRLATAIVAAAVLLPVAQAGAQAASTSEWGEYGMPRAMPSDYAAHLGQLPRAMPSDYGTEIQPGDYGMPRAMPADFEPISGTSGGNGFDWADAGIGAGATFGLVLLALAAATSLRGGRRVEQA
jgi:hypothetical protein